MKKTTIESFIADYLVEARETGSRRVTIQNIASGLRSLASFRREGYLLDLANDRASIAAELRRQEAGQPMMQQAPFDINPEVP
jgi:hypothetical protein